MAPIYLDDGYTAAKKLAARPGLHAAAEVEYRPGLSRKRLDYQKLLGPNTDAARVEGFENELIEEHVVKLNGDPVPKGRACRIVPELRRDLLNLILGYEPADEASDAKN